MKPNPIKLTKKDQAILDTFSRPFSTVEICTRINELSQNAIKFIWTELELHNTELIKEEETIVIPARSRVERTLNMVMGSDKTFETARTVHEPEHTRKQFVFNLRWLRFDHGTAMVGVEINGKFYVHKKFFDYFKDKPRIRLEQFDYELESWKRYGGKIFEGDDFPRIKVNELQEIERVGDWVIAE